MFQWEKILKIAQFLSEVTGMVESVCGRGFKSHALSVSGKQQNLGNKLRMLLQLIMRVALSRCIHIVGDLMTYFVSLPM